MATIGKGAEILVLDDDATDVMIAKRAYDMCRISNSWNSFQTCEEFFAYLEKVKSNKLPMPELVLTDINMPTMSGFEVLKAIRAMPEFTQLPILLVLSNSDSPDDRQQAQNSGAAWFIVKPNSIQEYVNTFKRLGDQLPK